MKSHSIDIAGQRLSIRSTATESHMRRLADLVNGRIKALRAGAPSVPLPTVLALAAIQIADDLCELEDFVVRERREVAADVRRVATALDKGVAAVDRWVEAAAKPAKKD
ncbi:MAG: cell division protein ZapA [Deltaproteobacteria bacterium]|nr:cell division protein ZapA [Deltaproteobacteria bacterium]